MYQRSCTVCFSVNAEFFSAISPQVRKRGGGVRSSLFCTISARVVAEFEASLCQDVSPLPFLFSKHCLAPFHTVCLAETFICNTHYTHAQHHCHHYTPNPRSCQAFAPSAGHAQSCSHSPNSNPMPSVAASLVSHNAPRVAKPFL